MQKYLNGARTLRGDSINNAQITVRDLAGALATIYSAQYIGVLGCATTDTCSANRNNHPGLLEHRAIGRELVKLVMGAA